MRLESPIDRDVGDVFRVESGASKTIPRRLTQHGRTSASCEQFSQIRNNHRRIQEVEKRSTRDWRRIGIRQLVFTPVTHIATAGTPVYIPVLQTAAATPGHSSAIRIFEQKRSVHRGPYALNDHEQCRLQPIGKAHPFGALLLSSRID